MQSPHPAEISRPIPRNPRLAQIIPDNLQVQFLLSGDSLHANTMFLSTSVIHDGTAFQNNPDTIKIKRILMDICDRTVLLVDSSKFRMGGLYRLASLDTFDHVLTDAQIRPAIHEQLKAAGMALEICQSDDRF
ncbi:hypothetical protein LDL32_03560 [Komagataeibacter sp. FNDCF1]|nr:hypothetical protein [Komagataeibacter sp. FNDCF1]MCE2563738.1 hypothetical protein [Komagataeibacter sp. FNDCF1]